MHPLLDQPLDFRPAPLHGETDHVGVAEPGAGIQRVLYVGGEGVALVQNGGDASLGIEGGAFGQGTFRHQGDAERGCKAQGKGQPCGATADDEHVVGMRGRRLVGG